MNELGTLTCVFKDTKDSDRKTWIALHFNFVSEKMHIFDFDSR